MLIPCNWAEMLLKLDKVVLILLVLCCQRLQIRRDKGEAASVGRSITTRFKCSPGT